MRKILEFKLVKILVLLIIFVITILSSPGCAGNHSPKNGKIVQTPSPTQKIIRIGVLKSPASLNFFGWQGEEDLACTVGVLESIGLKPVIIEENQLAKVLPSCQILILPNTRCLAPASIEQIRRYSKQGGKILATYMSGYRDQNNQSIKGTDNFQLADIYGVDFHSWVQKKGECEYIEIAGKPLQLGRNQAMLVIPGKDVKTLGIWLNSKKTAQKINGVAAAAITYNPETGAIYCGEDIFCQENGNSGEVKIMTAQLLERLHPGLINEKELKNIKSKPVSIDIPGKIIKGVSPDGPQIDVGIGENLEETYILCKTNEIITSSKKIEEVKKEKTISTSPKIELGANRLLRLRAVSVQGKDPYTAVYDKGGSLLLRVYGDMIFSGGTGQEPVSLIDLKANGTFTYRAYRGSLIFRARPEGDLQVINRLSLEEYLAGVVPGEMPSVYPGEALKAMAVIARTFAVSTINSNKHKKDGFSICDQIHCQVYQGLTKERLSTSKAVNETSGIIATFNNKPAFTPFHAVCGGYCADSSSAWSSSTPYLVGGFDGSENSPEIDLSREDTFKNFIDNPPICYCAKGGRFRWTKKFLKKDLEKQLTGSLSAVADRRGEIKAGTLYSLKITDRAKDGRALTMEILTSEGAFTISKDKIRWITSGGKISTGGLPSTFFYIKDLDDSVEFVGGGWGHGVGLCQEGARGMAEIGKSWNQIIQHYYKGVSLTKSP